MSKRLARCVTFAAAAVGVIAVGLVPIVTAEAATPTVTITDHLQPASLTVSPGVTVVWRNADSERHRMRTTSGPGEFDGDMEPGETYSFTFHSTGTYRYLDERDDENQAYWGTVVVQSSGRSGGGGSGGGGSTAPPPSSAPSTAAVTIGDRSFSPPSVSIAAGGTVTWSNSSGRDHTVTASDRSFDSGVVGSGGRYSRRFASAGTFRYLCLIHTEMTGTVNVGGGSGGAAPAPAPPPAPAPAPPPAPPQAVGGGTTPPAPGARSPSTQAVQVVDFAYQPPALTLNAGDTVVWTNGGQAPHTVTDRGGAFDSGTLSAGGRSAVTFREAGSFRYFCNFHPNMQGSLGVRPVAGISGGISASPASGGSSGGAAIARAAGKSPPAARGEANAPASATVTMRDFEFTPSTVRIAGGGEVTWRNAGETPHTATGGDFDSEIVQPGDTTTRQFDEPGSYAYRCTLHPQMTGTVQVVKASATAPASDDATSRDQDGADDSVAASGEPASGGAGPRPAPSGVLLGFGIAFGAVVTFAGRMLFGPGLGRK